MASLSTEMKQYLLQFRIGCSGFSYDSWKGFFYPEGLAKSKWLAHYATQFNTLEVNSSFYRNPLPSTLQKWYDQVPANFEFAMKAPKAITHIKRFSETGELLQYFYQLAITGLREKLGPVLFQLPPSFAYTPELLQRILSQLSPEFKNVVEFRHRSWWNQRVYDILGEVGISFCGHSYPSLPDELIANTPLVYYRFHGVPKLYYSGYEESFLTQIVERIKVDGNARLAYLYFNNTAEAAALENARFVQKLTA
jgi:uncharacterized protein YecE (DUF72 family)